MRPSFRAAAPAARRVRSVPIAVLVFLAILPAHRAAAGLPFALRTERARYLLGEPVYLRMEGAGARPPALEEGTIRLVIRGPGGDEHVYRPPLRLRLRPQGIGPAGAPSAEGALIGMPGAAGGSTRIAGAGAGGPAPSENGPVRPDLVHREAARPDAARPEPARQAQVRYARLIAEGGGWVFPHPGRYQLRLQAPAEAGAAPGLSREPKPLSDTVSVEIAPPTAPEDRRAYALIERAPEEYALAVYLEGGDQLQAGMEVVRGLAAFPNAYARVAAFVLCSDWAQDFRGRSGGAPRALDLGRALSFARFDASGGAYLPLRTAFRLRQAIAVQSARAPGDPALAAARARLGAFEDTLSAEERSWLAAF